MGEFLERLKTATAVMFRGGAPAVQLPSSGRSSVETTGLGGMMSSYLTGFSSVSPVIDWEMLRTLKHFSIFNPDMSQFIANIVDLGNTGHQLSVDAASSTVAETAVNRLNESAARIYPNAAGVDGLINQYFASVAWSGALSSEDVVDLRGRRVDRVVMVPVEQVRFFYNKDTDRYDAYQRTAGSLTTPGANAPGGKPGMLQLNPETYKYYALSTIENSPYAKPPASAAIEAILQGQIPIMENLRWAARKYGILGIVAVSVAPIKQKPNETDDEYRLRMEAHIKNYAQNLSGNFNQGLIVLPKPNTIDTTTLATNGAGFAELNTVNEQQVMSAFGQPPAFFGRTDSSTETYANVVYNILLGQVSNIRRLPKRRMERTYMLDLMLAGITVNGVTMTFNKAHSRDALGEAQTDSVVQAGTIERVRTGMISPDEGAQEAGYESWFDPSLIAGGITFTATTRQSAGTPRHTIRLSFDKDKQRYTYRPEVIELASEDDEDAGRNVVQFIKKKKRLTA